MNEEQGGSHAPKRKRTGRKALVPSTVDGLQSLQVQREVAAGLVEADPEAAELLMHKLARALREAGHTFTVPEA